MKQIITPTITFNPAARTLDFSAFSGFDIKRLVSVINQTTGAIIYSTASPDLGFLTIVGSVVTLKYDTTTMNAADVVQVFYDINESLVPQIAMPESNSPFLPIRQLPQRVIATSYSKAGAGVSTDEEVLIRTGAGMTVNRSGGNLVIVAGTTVNAETIIRSLASVDGRVTFSIGDTLSQRIINNNFYREFVDVLGDSLPYNIVNATTVDVTLTAHGFTSENVGQIIDLSALSSVGVPMEGIIASIPNANTIRFTVAGWPASGSGTLSLTGWNKIEINFTGATATTVNINSRRKGYQNASTAITISTTATGSLIMATLQNDRITFASGTLAIGSTITDRSVVFTNIPEPDVQFYYQIRAKNGTVAPASSTTWTCAFTRMQDFISTQVELTGMRSFGLGTALPVNIIAIPTVTVTGTVVATVTGGTVLPVTPTTTFTNSAASTNGIVIKATAGTLWSIVASNVNAAVRFLKVYNSATVTVGTTVPAFVIAIPPNSTVQFNGGSNGIRFATGICIGITTGAADGDTGAVAANEIKVSTSWT